MIKILTDLDALNPKRDLNIQKLEQMKRLFIDYKLERMKNTTNRINYTITLNVTKENNKYVVSNPTDNDLKKIHGIYNYELS